MKRLRFIFLLVGFFVSFSCFAQSISISNTTGEATITKSTVQVPSIPTGEPFNYSINFQNLNQSNVLSITDVLPAGLCYSPSDIVADPSFLDFSGNVVPNPNGIPGLIDTSSLPTVTFVIPNYVQRGSFTITVRFCAGITPDGFTATNNICATYGPGNSNDENFCSTTGLTSTAFAVNPWGDITKEPLFPAVLGSDGNYYIPTSGGVANYKIRVEKDPLYASSIFGMLNLTNASISELFMPCATVSLVSGPGTYNSTTNTITLNNDLNGNVPYESAEFIIQVDYSACGTFADGQVIQNSVELNGTPVGESPLINIANDTANVYAVDNLPTPNGNTSFTKSVEVSNPVPGCMGTYVISVVNNDNRPISFTEIADVLPNDIIPQNINISGLINSASTTDTFDLSINAGAPIVFSLATGYSANPTWNTTNNSFHLIAHTNTLLYPGDLLQITISFTINTGLPTGTSITNCAQLDGAIVDIPNNINFPVSIQSCVPFTVENPQVKLCADKKVRKANTNDAFESNLTNIVPTDELEFQICIQNNGSLDFIGQLVDVLDPKYEFISENSSSLPSGAGFTQSGQTLTWNNIDLVQNCSSFSYIQDCINPSNQSFCISIIVRVRPYTLPGNIDNNATLSDTGTNSVVSEFAKVNIIESSVLTFVKEISENQTDYSQSLSIDPDCVDNIFYKLTVTNLGNKEVAQYQIIDEMPIVGDVYFPTTLARNSSFSLENFVDYSAPDYTVSYLNSIPSATTLPADFDCNTVPPGNPTSSSTTQTIVYNSNNPLSIGESSSLIIQTDLPNSTSLVDGDIAINSAYLVNCDPLSGIIIPSNMVELLVNFPSCILNFSPYQRAVPDLFPLSVEQELNTDSWMTKDKEYGDIDDDGDIDILFTKRDTATNFPVIHYLENTAGSGNPPVFSLPSVNLGIQNARSYRFYDWNNDGCNDIVVLGWNAGVVVFINDCTASFTFGSYLLYDLIDYRYNDDLLMSIGDLNNDTLPDIVISSQSTAVDGTSYFEHNGASSYPFYILTPPQVYVPNSSGVTNPFIPENNGSYPTPEIYDADCDGDLDLFISDPLLPGPPYGGARMYFHENNGNTTAGTLPDVNVTGVTNQFGLNDEPVPSSLQCDWIITRIVDYFGNDCPIAISYNSCSGEFYYYLQEDCLCPGELVLSIDDTVESENLSNFKLFPNPTTNIISIEGKYLSEFMYEVYNIQGSKITSGTFLTSNAINVSTFSNGVYILKIYNNKRSETLKFIKQ